MQAPKCDRFLCSWETCQCIPGPFLRPLLLFFLYSHSLLGRVSNSGHNSVEQIAILKFGSDHGARFNSKLEDFAVSGRNGAQLSAISRPKSVHNGTRTECSPGQVGSAVAPLCQLDQDCTLFEFLSQISGLEIAESCAPLRSETAKSSSFESNRAPWLLPNFRIAIRSTGL